MRGEKKRENVKKKQKQIPVLIENTIMGRGQMPTRAHDNDAGFDIYVSEQTVVSAHSFADVPSGVKMELPEGHWGLLTGRSSTLRQRGLLVVQGVIDQGYRGELFSAVWNLIDCDVVLEEGDRVAQLILVPNATERFDLVQVDVLSQSLRGEAGFGSSGR